MAVGVGNGRNKHCGRERETKGDQKMLDCVCEEQKCAASPRLGKSDRWGWEQDGELLPLVFPPWSENVGLKVLILLKFRRGMWSSLASLRIRYNHGRWTLQTSFLAVLVSKSQLIFHRIVEIPGPWETEPTCDSSCWQGRGLQWLYTVFWAQDTLVANSDQGCSAKTS